MAGRLVRRQRKAAPQALHHQIRGANLPDNDAAEGRCNKKTAGPGTTGNVCAAYAETQPRRAAQTIVALELGQAARNIPAADLTEIIPLALTERWRKNNSVNTRRKKHQALRMVLRHIAKIGGADIAAAVQRPPAYQQRTVTATPEELAALLSKSPPWMRCFTLLCCQLGLRFAEAASVSPATWKPDQHTIAVLTKGGKTRVMPTTPELEEMFTVAMRTEAPPDTAFIWLLLGKPAKKGPHAGTLERAPDNTIRYAWTAIKKRLSINPDLHIHDLRRTRITEVYRQTLDVKLAQQFAGHNSIASTALYLAPWDDAKILDTIRRTAPPGGWQKAKAAN